MKIRNALMLKDAKTILHNRFILYFVLFLALSDISFLVMGSEFVLVSIFILSGFVTSFFSKNMIVIMCIALVITNILRYGTNINTQEGLDNKPTLGDDTDTMDDKPKDENPVDDKPKDANLVEENMVHKRAKKMQKGENVMTPKNIKKFKENMDKLEAYEPLFTSMDKLMENISGLMYSQ
jgi:hypothetical protein